VGVGGGCLSYFNTHSLLQRQLLKKDEYNVGQVHPDDEILLDNDQITNNNDNHNDNVENDEKE